MATDGFAQYLVPAQAVAQRKAFRHYFSGWVDVGAASRPYFMGFLASDLPTDQVDFTEALRDKAHGAGHLPVPDGAVTVSHAISLLMPPLPPIGDARPLLAWAVKTYFVCDDVKFGGYGDGIFAWPEKPAGAALSAMLNVLISDTLAGRTGTADGHLYSKIISIDVQPSALPPTHL